MVYVVFQELTTSGNKPGWIHDVSHTKFWHNNVAVEGARKKKDCLSLIFTDLVQQAHTGIKEMYFFYFNIAFVRPIIPWSMNINGLLLIVRQLIEKNQVGMVNQVLPKTDWLETLTTYLE